MSPGSWLQALRLSDRAEFAEAPARQRLDFLLIGTSLAISGITLIAAASVLFGRLLLVDLGVAIALAANYLYLLRSRNLQRASFVGISIFAAFMLEHMFTGGNDGTGPLWCFVFPPAAIYMLGARPGAMFALLVLSPMLAFLLVPSLGQDVLPELTPSFELRFVLAYLCETLLFYVMEIQKTRAQKQVGELQDFLPICAACKKIRDDDGYWNQLEAYIERNAGTRFSHGLCPACARELYPDLDLDEHLAVHETSE